MIVRQGRNKLNADIERHTADQRECSVEWAVKLFKEKYNLKNLLT